VLKKLDSNPGDPNDIPTRDDSMAAGALIAACMGFVVLFVGGLGAIGLAVFVLKTPKGRLSRDRGIALTAIVVAIISLIVSVILTWIMIKWNREFPTNN
jgi:heme/copper-type cytochrome/quinol oxidase subunit 2